MSPGLRLVCATAIALVLLFLPVGDAAMLLALMLAIDVAASALILRRPAPPPQPGAVVAIRGEDAGVPLRRRTVPELRMRRPSEVIEAQIRWRQAAATRRQNRDIA